MYELRLVILAYHSDSFNLIAIAISYFSSLRHLFSEGFMYSIELCFGRKIPHPLPIPKCMEDSAIGQTKKPPL